MYYLLIEAGGLRQIAKINTETYERVVADINAKTGDSGFLTRFYDGDDIFYSADAGYLMEPKHVAAALEGIVECLSGHIENILDYTVLLHSAENQKPETVFLEMQDLLRYARQQDCAYVTPLVLPAIRSVVETDDGDPLSRITVFRGDHILSGPSLRSSLVGEEKVNALLGAIDTTASGRICVRAPEASVPMEIVRTVADRLAENGDTLVVSVFCDEAMTPSDLFSRILQALPLDLSRSGSESGAIPASLLPVFHERFYHSAGSGILTDTEPGELRVTTRHLLEGVALRVSRIVVLLVDLDLCPPTVRNQVDPLFADVVFDTACTILATAVDPPDDEGWTIIEAATTAGENPRDLRYSGVLEYWEQLPHDRAARNPVLVPGLSKELRAALAVIRELGDAVVRRFLYLIDKNGCVLHGDHFDRLFPDVGVSLVERARIVTELDHWGLLLSSSTWQIHPAIAGTTGALLEEAEREIVDETIRVTLEALLAEGSLNYTPRLWAVYENVADGSQRGALWHTYVHALAGAGAIGAFDALPDVRSARVRAHEVSYRSARIRLHLRDSRGPETCAPDAAKLADPAESVVLDASIRIDAQLSLGEWELASRHYDAAMRLGKQAIMNQQSSGSSSTLAASHLLLARIMLAQRRISDAGHYLNFAREEATADRGTYLIAEMLDATRHFLIGNLSRAAISYESLVEPLARKGYVDWMLSAWFGRARVAFEFGDYHGSADLCRGIERFTGECGLDTQTRVARTWRIRSELLTDAPVSDLLSQLRDLPESGETLLVEAEYLLRESRNIRGIELLDRAIEVETDVDRWPRIGVCWDNGFAATEDLLLANQPGSTELLRLLSALRAWALGQEGRTEEAIDTFYRLTRTGDGMAEDPYTSFYTYLYASILPEERSRERDDRVTVLGKSVKILQERTSRIDDYRDKIRFLRHNTWNRRVMESAQRHNLV